MLVLIDENDTILDFRNEWWPSFGRHCIIDVTLDIFTPSLAKESFAFRDFKSIDSRSVVDLLSRSDWTAMNSVESDLEDALKNINDNLNVAIDKLASLKTVCPSKKYPPWFGPELKQLTDKRNATHRRYKRTGRAELLDEFLQLCNEVDACSAQERSTFLQQHLFDALENDKNIWKEMRNLDLLPKRKGKEFHGLTPCELTEHFARISSSSLENLEDVTDTILSASEEDFSFSPVNISDVVLAISHFSSQARGVDGVPKEVIVKALPVIGEFIIKTFNSSFALGVFPGIWKQAQLIALKKKKTAHKSANNRVPSL